MNPFSFRFAAVLGLVGQPALQNQPQMPDADHLVQQDAPERETRTMVDWLKR